MERIYLFEGIDCANCALTLERKLNKVEGINKCTINFMNKKVIFDHEENADFEKIVEICRDFEDGVTLKRIK